MRKTTIFILALLIVAAAFATAVAMKSDITEESTGEPPRLDQGMEFDGPGHKKHGHERRGHPADRLARALESLNLTAEQKTSIAVQLKAERNKMEAMRESVHEDMKAMRQAQFEGDVETVRTLSRKMAQHRQTGDMERASVMAMIRRTLTAPQIAQLDAMHQQFVEKREKERPRKRVTMDAWILENI